ncbi:hypothetical protein GOBAR_AA30643 [Gossypium barbadense]|uniref:Uncharacterized protein n=1 Tax=Gossypium barbadense TaxID=3634 RepID=A0A2P5WG52_GOSBA|nr:hypothetical protein GOBAR_AA30643 [Gossypium barbadense]
MASELHQLEERVRRGRKGESDFSRLPLFSTLSIHSSRNVLAVQLRRSDIVLCKSIAGPHPWKLLLATTITLMQGNFPGYQEVEKQTYYGLSNLRNSVEHTWSVYKTVSSSVHNNEAYLPVLG